MVDVVIYRDGQERTFKVKIESVPNSVTSNSSSIQPAPEQPKKSETVASQKLRELKKIKDEGLITDKEYEQKKKAILDAM